MIVETHDILFIGMGQTSVCWYRCALPALNLGADWCGVVNEPPNLGIATGIVRNDTRLPDYDDYKVVVIQQPFGQRWLKLIRELQASGIKVIFEVDDYLHGVGKQRHHDFAKSYSRKRLREFELCMRVCDALICSTDYIARRYRSFNPNVFVCRNGIDAARYDLTLPPRETVNIGWAGATGHKETLVAWMNQAVLPVMAEHEETCFVSVGDPFLSEAIKPIVGERRAVGTPFTMLENYPAAMTMIDIAIGPAGKTNWYRGKSDLRWLEAAALGIPIVADAELYSEIDHGRTGYKVTSPGEARGIIEQLVVDPEARRRVGYAARHHARHQRGADIAALHWLAACRAVAGDDESPPLFAPAAA